MQSSKIKLWTGAELNLYTVFTSRTPEALVYLTHGMSEHPRKYRCFLEILPAQNIYIVTRFTWAQPYFANDATGELFAIKNGLGKVIEDHDFATDYISQKRPTVPVFRCSHFLKSISVLKYAMKHSSKLSGLACWKRGIELLFYSD